MPASEPSMLQPHCLLNEIMTTSARVIVCDDEPDIRETVCGVSGDPRLCRNAGGRRPRLARAHRNRRLRRGRPRHPHAWRGRPFAGALPARALRCGDHHADRLGRDDRPGRRAGDGGGRLCRQAGRPARADCAHQGGAAPHGRAQAQRRGVGQRSDHSLDFGECRFFPETQKLFDAKGAEIADHRDGIRSC